MKLRVWAHWIDQQPPTSGYLPLPPAPFPASLASYPIPGGLPPKNAGLPVWPPTPVGLTNLQVTCVGRLVHPFNTDEDSRSQSRHMDEVLQPFRQF